MLLQAAHHLMMAALPAAQHMPPQDASLAQCCRRLLINTGWVPGLPVGSYFRFSNVTVSCTGNLTHPLPPGAHREADAMGQLGHVANRRACGGTQSNPFVACGSLLTWRCSLSVHAFQLG